MAVTKKSKPQESSQNTIQVVGARVHNLKNVTVSFPRNQFIVVTGVSGSGKSSLTIDTLFAEGQRRYVFHHTQDNLCHVWENPMWIILKVYVLPLPLNKKWSPELPEVRLEV
jgi:predicted GTPase